MWWSTFIATWNGVSLFPGLPIGQIVTSDIKCFRVMGVWCLPSVTGHAMVPTAVAPRVGRGEHRRKGAGTGHTLSAAIWGHIWHKQKVVYKSDNMTVVIALNKRSAKDPRLAHLLRCLFFFEAHFGFEHEAQHIPGIK